MLSDQAESSMQRATFGLTLAATLAMAPTLVASGAMAAEACRAVVLADVAGWDNPADVRHKGEVICPVTEYAIETATGIGRFCAHGGGCYPRYATSGAKRVEVMRLTNCRIGALEPPIPGNDRTVYDVVLLHRSPVRRPPCPVVP